MFVLIVKVDNGGDYDSYWESIERVLLFSTPEQAELVKSEFDKLPNRYTTEICPVILDDGVGLVAKTAWRARASAAGKVVRFSPHEGVMEIAKQNETARLEQKTPRAATIISFVSQDHAAEQALQVMGFDPRPLRRVRCAGVARGDSLLRRNGGRARAVDDMVSEMRYGGEG